MRPGWLAAAVADPLSATAWYEAHKRSYNNTEQDCLDAGLAFVPVVFDADGGFGSSAKGLLGKLADDSAAMCGMPRSVLVEAARQQLAVAIAHTNATAILRRRPRSSFAYGLPQADTRAEFAAAAAPTAPTTAAAQPPVAPLGAASGPPTGALPHGAAAGADAPPAVFAVHPGTPSPPASPDARPPPLVVSPVAAAAAAPQPAPQPQPLPAAGRGRGLVVPSSPSVAAAGASAASCIGPAPPPPSLPRSAPAARDPSPGSSPRAAQPPTPPPSPEARSPDATGLQPQTAGAALTAC
jgi:hypothetical protein